MKYLPLLVLFTFFISCDRDKTSVAGKGGKATLNVTIMHDGNYANNGTVYIEYNSEDKPAENAFDDSAKCVLKDGKPVATFSNLRAGKYYLFGIGYDPVHADEIKGGAKYVISKEEVLEYKLTTAH